MLKIVKRVFSIAGKYKGKLILSFFMSFLENAMSALSFFFIFLAFKWIVEGSISADKIMWLAVVLVTTLILRFVFKLLEYILQSGTGYEIVCDERLRLGEKVLHLSMGFYQDMDAGNISSVINNDLVFIEGMAMSFVSKIVGGIISVVLMMAVLFVLDWRIALVACIGYPISLIANRMIQRIYTKCSADRQRAHAETSSVILEYLQGIYVIKAFRFAGKQKERFESILKNLELASYDFEMKILPWMGLYLVSFHIGTALVLAATTFFFLSSGISLLVVLIIVAMIFAIYAPVELIGSSSGFIRLLNACLDRMKYIMDYPVLDADSSEVSPEQFDVSFSNVYFSYGVHHVLNNITFRAPEHSMTAIVGPSGSGKSTILNLIARFWDVNSGTIKIGGIDIKKLKCETVMQNISAVFQKAYLFHDTVYNNILFGNPDAEEKCVINAAKKAHCHEFIMQMEHGYDTVIGEGGSTISGGERQRISIARALLKDAPIILLDEVTANIDPQNEKLIQQAINRLVEDKTVFVVAHKIATIRNANQIIVLSEHGKISEIGTHEELLQRSGEYMMLWKKSQQVSNWVLSTETK